MKMIDCGAVKAARPYVTRMALCTFSMNILCRRRLLNKLSQRKEMYKRGFERESSLHTSESRVKVIQRERIMRIKTHSSFADVESNRFFGLLTGFGCVQTAGASRAKEKSLKPYIYYSKYCEHLYQYGDCIFYIFHWARWST